MKAKTTPTNPRRGHEVYFCRIHTLTNWWAVKGRKIPLWIFFECYFFKDVKAVRGFYFQNMNTFFFFVAEKNSVPFSVLFWESSSYYTRELEWMAREIMLNHYSLWTLQNGLSRIIYSCCFLESHLIVRLSRDFIGKNDKQFENMLVFLLAIHEFWKLGLSFLKCFKYKNTVFTLFIAPGAVSQ